MFICVFAFIRSVVARIVAALFFSLMCVSLFHQVKPYRSWFNNVLAEVCHYFLALVFFTLLLIETDAMKSLGISLWAMGALLTVALVGIGMTVLVRALSDNRLAITARTARVRVVVASHSRLCR
jgi:hypothetical protein